MMMKRLTIKMDRVYTFIESELSETRKKFLNFHQHHEYCKFLKKDFLPKEKERSILIIADKFGKVHKETIDLIPFDYILIVDPFFDKYTCLIIDGKKVFQIPLEPVIFLQIAQSEKLIIDSLFLSNKTGSHFDFLLEMSYPLMKEEFYLITNSGIENQQHTNCFEKKIKTLPFEIFHKVEQDEFEQFDLFMFMNKTNESKTFKINGKVVTVSHMSFWNHIDTSLEVHFTTFSDEWSEYLIRLYEIDIYDLDGVYVVSSDNKVYDLKKMDDLYALIKRCEYKIIGISLNNNPRIYEHIFHILMSENQVQKIYIYGFFDEGNTI